jgi:hypothetical protein
MKKVVAVAAVVVVGVKWLTRALFFINRQNYRNMLLLLKIG